MDKDNTLVQVTRDDIDHIESQSLSGVGIVKIFFHSGVDIRTATAQVTSNAENVSSSMESTGSAANQVVEAAIDLNRQAEALRAEIGTFLDNIRVA